MNANGRWPFELIWNSHYTCFYDLRVGGDGFLNGSYEL